MSDPDLPQVMAGELDRDRVEALFADLAEHAEVAHVQVRERSGAGGPPRDRKTTLDDARAMTLDGSAAAVQIRYRYQDRDWCDTILRRSGALRLVRIEDPMGGPLT